MLEALLFDLDGTLTDTDTLHLQALQQLLREQGRELSEAEFDAHVSGRANADMCRYLFPGRPVAEHEAFADRKEARFRALSPTLQPTAGLERLLAHAERRGIGMAVVTNAPRANAQHMLAAMGLAERFEHVLVAEELARAKPDPLPYLTGLERLGARADHALAFEDSVPGVTAASRAGILTVGLSTSQAPQVLLEAGAQLVVKNFDDERLWQLIAQMSG
ncbi:haloacid dehalogenase [Pseudomonas putida]|jgi:HAD superfamily hydrolase (TIGR01509 family)|uniref:HAD family hydrolase n=1 Tax=Pseudomonas TaxID=286 RepID=UPI0006D431EC|nr:MULTISPECIES: HAD-IA family hydrolase [Pseudomonas]KTC22281.1 haloacid dehalogenase [Pseudomonas putida]MCP8351181.1 HAD family hydrolase [Pseudomonas sp. FBF18]MCQ0167343.1 HAD family hydrolase [Pseudomonas sp. S12(2018)]MEC6744130.1 HAD-IA family hydrolase [Pseudomonas qingdaonensis]WEJ19588.1 HAD-IA family hydrolase [Pseudomonas sp. SD17-1]